MSQHDYNIANQSGAATRADINLAFVASVENNYGASAPPTTFAYMFWSDSGNDIFKQRNAANTAWISLWTLSTGVMLQAVSSATSLLNTAGEQLPSLGCVQAAGALTFSSAAQYRDFRSATLTDGSGNSTLYAAPSDTVLPSGGTLGFTSGVEGTILVAEMNFGGVKELVFCNKAGGLQMDESNLISPTAVSTGSDSAAVWYSTTARTNLPYRILGEVKVTNTAGAWGDPTSIQPAGGLAVISGRLAQPVLTYQTGAVATGSNPMPGDNSIPQITEGDQYMSLTVPPTKIGNLLEIDSTWIGSSSATDSLSAALFKSTSANAVSSSNAILPANYRSTHVMKHTMLVDSLSPLTFTVRAGTDASSTVTSNGTGGTGIHGGVLNSRITIKEYIQ